MVGKIKQQELSVDRHDGKTCFLKIDLLEIWKQYLLVLHFLRKSI